jgi:hypothetical protein
VRLTRTKLFPSNPGQPNPFGTPEVGGKIYNTGATRPVPLMRFTLPAYLSGIMALYAKALNSTLA